MSGYERCSKDDKNTENWCFNTSFREEHSRISWCIENINRCVLKFGQFKESPSFCTGFTSEIKWVIRIYPKGRKVPEKVGIFIHKMKSSHQVHLKYKIELKYCKDESQDELRKYEVHSVKPDDPDKLNDLNIESSEWGSDEFLPSADLYDQRSFLIVCYLTVIYFDESYIAGPTASFTLHDDLNEIYKSGKFSDLTVVVKNEHFIAHKVILAARSKVFAAMFDHETKGNLSNVITIEDVEPTIMGSVLQYIYSGKVEDLTMEKAIRMFSVADKYSLVELRNHCIAVILSKLSVENACQIAKLAYEYSVPQLKRATNLMIRKYTNQIFEQVQWKEILKNKPKLASEILLAVSSEFNEIIL